MPRKTKIKRSFTEDRVARLRTYDRGSWFNQEPRSPEDATIEAPDFDKFAGLDEEDFLGTCFEREKETECQADIDDNDRTGYRLCDMDLIYDLIAEHTSCKKCHGRIQLVEDTTRRTGWCSLLQLKCSGCGVVQTTHTSRVSSGKVFDVNRRVVLASRAMGKGHTAMVKFSGIMNMPPPVSATPWKKHSEEILEVVQTYTDESMTEAARDVKEQVGSEEVPMSFDGSWSTRGLTSKHGFVTAISINTGKVVDRHFMTKYCQVCAQWEGKPKDMDYLDFYVNHFEVCKVNHEGSAQSMESDGVLELFMRSEEERGLLYNPYVGDGDSASFSKVCRSEPYGKDFMHKKSECVGHVQKRMGTRLRKIVNEYKGRKLADGKGIQGKGRLTNARIDSFQTFYGKAIRSNKMDSEAMARDTWAILHHYKESPEHHYCPDGQTSWCKFKSDLATGVSTYRPPKNGLPDVIVQLIKPVFHDLTRPELLKACEDCFTQNSNEALHHVVWSFSPKDQHQSATAVEVAVNLGVLCFNEGLVMSMKKVMGGLGLHFGKHSEVCLTRLDNRREVTGLYKGQEVVKNKRREGRSSKLKQLDAFQKSEGSQYESGQFHAKPPSVRKCLTCQQPMKGHRKGSCNQPV